MSDVKIFSAKQITAKLQKVNLWSNFMSAADMEEIRKAWYIEFEKAGQHHRHTDAERAQLRAIDGKLRGYDGEPGYERR